MNISNFKNDLVYSLENRSDESLNSFYYKAFPHLKEIEIVTDNELQLRGIDKILHFEGGKSMLIDEKKRRKNYGDILLEEYSNYDSKKVGWVSKEKYTDYIVYAIIPEGIVYLFPFLLLQLAWIKNYTLWLQNYGRKFAFNESYVTSNIAVPTEELLEAIKKEMTMHVK